MDDQREEKIPELEILDKLIENYYSQLMKHGDDKVKLGDVLKMIELKRKLSPENSDQKKFWKMINKIRNENLKSDKNDDKIKNQVKNEK